MKYTNLTPKEVNNIRITYNEIIDLELLISKHMYTEIFNSYLKFKKDHKILKYFLEFKEYTKGLFCQEFFGFNGFSFCNFIEKDKVIFASTGIIKGSYKKYISPYIVNVLENEEQLWLNNQTHNSLKRFFKHLEFTDHDNLGVILEEKDVDLILKLTAKHKYLFNKASEWDLLPKLEVN